MKLIRDFIKILKDYKKGDLVRDLQINDDDIMISYYNSGIIRVLDKKPFIPYCATNLLNL